MYRYVGTYETIQGRKKRRLKVTLENQTLLIAEKGKFQTILEPKSDTIFQAKNLLPKAIVEFVMQENKVVQITINQGKDSLVWKKIE